jgi:MoxR-like ATPase
VSLASRVVIEADRRLAEQVRRLSAQRMVFVAGLPGTGKSLLVHQLVPTEEEAEECIRDVERGSTDPMALGRELARWWHV